MAKSGAALTLKEASDYTGKSIYTLRRFIKMGKLVQAYKTDGETGSMWVIPKSELEGLKAIKKAPGEAYSDLDQSMTNNVYMPNLISMDYYEKHRREWDDERLSMIKEMVNLKSGIEMYRYKYEELESRLKMLPAPVEAVTSKLKELEHTISEQAALLQEEQSSRANLANELQEKEVELRQTRLPWWKKIFSVR